LLGEASNNVVVVAITNATAEGDQICYRNTSTVTGTPDPLPDFPDGNPVWTNHSPIGSLSSATGPVTTYSPGGLASTTNNDIRIEGVCGTSSASAFITSVAVTGITFAVDGAGVDTPADTLGLGDVGTATALVSPMNRTLLWSDSVILSVDPGKPPVVEFSAAEEAAAVTVSVHPDSGSGLVQLTAVDSQTGCGWYRIITVGCSACSSCNNLGAMSLHVHSVSARFSLGSGYGGGSAGFLHITATEMSPELVSPTLDAIPPSDGGVHSTNCLGHIEGPGSYSTASADYLMAADDKKLLRQIKVPDGLVDIVVSNAFRYDMSFYPKSAVGPKGQGGYYTFTGAPSVTYIIENPDASTNVYNRLRISKVTGSETNVSEYVNTVEGGTNAWKLATGNGLKRETVNEYSAGGYTNTLRTVTDASNNIFSAVLSKSQQFPWGLARVEQVTDPDGAALSTSWSYYTNAADAGRYSRVAMQVNPDGSWEKHDYTPEGYPLSSVSSYLDASTNATAAEARATYYDYSLHAGETPGYRPSTARTVIETTLGVTNSITYRAFTTNGNGEREEITERAASASAAYGDGNNQRSVSIYYADDAAAPNAGRLRSTQTPDGRLTTYTYENGLFETNANPALCSFTAGGTNQYLRTTVTHGTVASPAGIAGKTTREVTIESPLGGQLMSETYAYTTNGYVRINWSVQILDATHRPVTVYNADGTRTDSTWGCCGKESETDTTGLEADYSYDALDRMDITTRQVGTNAIMTTYTYDAAGRRIKTTVSAGGLSQVTSNAYNTAGQLVESTDQQGIATTYAQSANGLTNTTIRACVTNTTVRYADGRTHYTEQNGTRQQTYDYGINSDGTQWTTTYTGPEGTNSPAWQKTTSDFLGRTVKTERPGYGGTTLITYNTYNTKGQLVETHISGFSPQSSPTLYVYNELGEQVRSGQDVDGDGTIDLGEMDRVSDSERYFEQDGSGDWWQVSVAKFYPNDNDATVVTNSIQRQRLTGLGIASDFGILTDETISIDLLGNQTTQQTHIDRENKEVVQLVDSPFSTTNQAQRTKNGLLIEQTSATGLVMTYGYDALGRRIATTDPRTGTSITHYNALGQVDWVEDAATNRTSFTYDPATGQRISTTDALTNTTHQVYSAEGQLIATWGATYPVYYEYDAFDRMSAMYTYRGTNEINSADDLYTLPTDRTTWSYDQATGLLTNKLYSDGKGTAYTYTPDGKLATRAWARGVVTTYSYDTCCGALTNITYSDGTPTITYTYDRLGRQKTVFQSGTGVPPVIHEFAYDPTTLALTHETIIANGVTNVITRTQDTYGRAAGFSLGADYAVAYAYDNTGRFASLQSSVSGLQSNLFTYTYLPDSSLISGYTAGDLAVSRSYEPNRNLITGIENMAGTNLISRFAYENDAIGRRTKRIDNASITNSFDYNIRSEVIEALMGTNTYGYAYDSIGNRLSEVRNLMSEVSTNLYTANALNQYSVISNFSSQVSSLIPQYDADGNMLTYNGWTFTWNGENRLITASNATTVIENIYDYMGRRITKTTKNQAQGTTNQTQFVYDGWAMIREQSATVTNSYVYGIDLSGSMQGAGTIGGILSADLNGATAFYCYDANGNVTDLVATNGNSVAHYEYGPFGQTIASRPVRLPTLIPFQFSNQVPRHRNRASTTTA
jgi:YD repeat-containing protein